jgi:1-phosphofructokinase family hexose kinase
MTPSHPILVAGPNLAIDRVVTLGELRPGEVLRLDRARISPGGKGLNVARAIRALGGAARVVTFVAGRTGAAVADLAADEGLELLRVEVPGEARAAVIVLERSGRVTVLNEPGPDLSDGDWRRFEGVVASSMDSGDGTLVCTGSLPPGVPDDAYARLVRIARSRSTLVVVDATGPALLAAADAGADLVTPNLAEAEEALGWSGETGSHGERAVRAAEALAGRSGGVAIVTVGEHGVAWSGRVSGPGGGDAGGRLDAPRVRHVNPIGAGDSFVAGLVLRLGAGAPLREAVAAGIAVAAASVETELPGQVDPGRAAQLEASRSSS